MRSKNWTPPPSGRILPGVPLRHQVCGAPALPPKGSERQLRALRFSDLYVAAARAVGVDSEDAVVFEDELRGVEAGRAGHCGSVVGVDRMGLADELREHGADVVVPDLAALLAPPQAEPAAAV